MHFRAISILTGLALLAAGCGHFAQERPEVGLPEVPGVSVVVSVKVKSGQLYTTQTLAPFTANSIAHLVLSVSEVTPDGQQPVLDGQGQPVQADLTRESLLSTLEIQSLRPGRTYAVLGRAYKAAGTDPLNLISDDNASSASIAIDGSQTAVPLPLTVRLKDQLIEAEARGPVEITPGNLVVPQVGTSTATIDVSDVAGSSRGYLDGTAKDAKFDTPHGITVDAAGNIFVADSGNRQIRKIDPQGLVSTVAPFSVSSLAQLRDTANQFGFADGLVADRPGEILLADSRQSVITWALIDTTQSVLAGNGDTLLADGEVASASFGLPSGILVRPDGVVLVVDTLHHCVRWVAPYGYVYTWLGNGEAGSQDGVGQLARFNHPTGIAQDHEGNFYIADTDNHMIRKVLPDGTVSTLAGAVGLFGDADGLAAEARFDGPTGLAVGQDDTLYVADTHNNVIRAISTSGVVTTLSGSGYAGHVNASNDQSQFKAPSGLAIDPQGNLIVADTLNHRIRRITIR